MVVGLRRLLGFGRAKAAPEAARPARILSLKEMPAAIYAVGDVHGCLGLYRRMEELIVADAAAEGLVAPKLIVLLGDVVDRGPDPAGIIRHLLEPAPAGFQRIVLRGNHEELMAAFLRDPASTRRWLAFGGAETLMSYGLHPDPETGFETAPHKLAQMLDLAIPEPHRRFLDDLPYALQVGQTIFSHAGLDPEKPIADQNPVDLIWGVPERADTASHMEHALIVHGHVITTEVKVSENRINVDTGAYESGVLSGVRLTEGRRPVVLSVAEKAN